MRVMSPKQQKATVTAITKNTTPAGKKNYSPLNFVISVIKSIPLFLRYAKILMFGKVDYGL